MESRTKVNPRILSNKLNLSIEYPAYRVCRTDPRRARGGMPAYWLVRWSERVKVQVRVMPRMSTFLRMAGVKAA